MTKRTVTPIVALDFPTAQAALVMVGRLGDRCGFYKVGSELFTAAGPAIVHELLARRKRVFLDLKLHDIPNTVGRAAASAREAGASMLTVHAVGGSAMLRAAVDSAGQDCKIFAVTVLTSLDGDTLGEAWGRPVSDVTAEVIRLADLARRSGAAGVVCSGLEAAALRDHFGDTLELLVPGVRLPEGGPAGSSGRGDQVRVVTPAEAAAAGASYIILGRTVTGAVDPEMAMDQAVASVA